MAGVEAFPSRAVEVEVIRSVADLEAEAPVDFLVDSASREFASGAMAPGFEHSRGGRAARVCGLVSWVIPAAARVMAQMLLMAGLSGSFDVHLFGVFRSEAS